MRPQPPVQLRTAVALRAPAGAVGPPGTTKEVVRMDVGLITAPCGWLKARQSGAHHARNPSFAHGPLHSQQTALRHCCSGNHMRRRSRVQGLKGRTRDSTATDRRPIREYV
jgi:hypothetical protein